MWQNQLEIGYAEKGKISKQKSNEYPPAKIHRNRELSETMTATFYLFWTKRTYGVKIYLFMEIPTFVFDS